MVADQQPPRRGDGEARDTHRYECGPIASKLIVNFASDNGCDRQRQKQQQIPPGVDLVESLGGHGSAERLDDNWISCANEKTQNHN